uniref:Putative protease with a role in cell division n=1 Tax=Magnetococcus massalia (strain MO-1) TaxID=451514 RepID=A0A1S7LL46_MAGMO|nr:Putative protease with a role in cell division [Candidatus Magnetococcus massalia]
MLLLLLSTTAQPLFAASGDAERLARSKVKLASIVDRLRDEQKALEKARGQERSLLDELDRLDRELADKRTKLVEITQQDRAIKNLLPTLNARVDAQKMAMAKQQQLLAGHLRLFYGMGGKDALRMLAPRQHAQATMQHMTYFRYLIQARNKQFQRYHQTVQDLQLAIKEQRHAIENLKKLKQHEGTVRQALEVKKVERTRLLSQVQERRELHSHKVAELKEAYRKLGAFVKRLTSAIDKEAPSPRVVETGPSFAPIRAMRGKLNHPVSVAYKKRGPGLFYVAKQNTPVRAIYRGQVVYADWFKGYGQLMILHHGDKIYSLYGHNRRLLASQGDWVEEGDPVAEVGDSGALDGVAGLYFEIRAKGQTVNSRRWLHK